MSKGYNMLEIKSLYGIYDRCTPKSHLKKGALLPASKLCRIIRDNFPHMTTIDYSHAAFWV